MELLFFDRLEETAFRDQVYTLLSQCDREFVPPLSQRTSTTQSVLTGGEESDQGLQSYFQNLLNQPVILATEGSQLLGFMSFIGDFICQDAEDNVVTAYVSTVIVAPPHRGKGLTRQMYEKLLCLTALPISTRTWSTNLSHITVLSRLGFYELLRIQDGRGPGVDTVYYRKDRTDNG